MRKGQPSSRNALFEEWLKDVQNPITADYIKDCVIGQMDWFGRESAKCKKGYKNWMLCSIIISGLIPVASVFADGTLVMKVIIAVLGSAVTVVSAYLRLQRYQELWGNYRYNREYLRSTLCSYFIKTGTFANCTDQEARDKLLVEKTCEDFFRKEVEVWKGRLDSNDS